MAHNNLGKRKRGQEHPYLAGNFAPIRQELPLTPCSFTGEVPEELYGGQYVRNGGNPVMNEDFGHDAHWFDGDGMLAGINFRRENGKARPEYVNQYILTDILLSTVTSPHLRAPILPSIASLVNPLTAAWRVGLMVFRTIFLVILSRLPGSRQPIYKISVANTAVVYHDGRALATCESGTPMRVALPGLETIGWFDGKKVEGEAGEGEGEKFGGKGIIGFMKEWTTAHPKIDPSTNEMISFHSTFLPPYIHYSIVPATHNLPAGAEVPRRLINGAVSGVSSAKMMHDFGVSPTHTIIMDLPLSLDPTNQWKGKPPVEYDADKPSRFGVFPRREPGNVTWFETDACCIFHTANSWDTHGRDGRVKEVNMLACRMTSATVVFSAGNVAAPQPTKKSIKKVRDEKRMPFLSNYDTTHQQRDPADIEGLSAKHPGVTHAELVNENELDPVDSDQCTLYYYNFDLDSGKITAEWSLSTLPFEFPSVPDELNMSDLRYVYGCSTSEGSFNTALGRVAKIDVLVKMDVKTLVGRGKAKPPRSVTGSVDTRKADEISKSSDPNDPIQLFRCPPGYAMQEPRFVRRRDATSEDDGYLLTYVFDEGKASNLDPHTGEALSSARSEFWVIDAKNMKDVVCKVQLPQRVPYGLHGNWFSEEKVVGQRPWESIRGMPRQREEEEEKRGLMWKTWMGVRGLLERSLG